MLLDHMRAPAGNAGGGKDRCVQGRIEFQHCKHRRGVKIDIRAQMFFALHRLLELLANWNPIFFAGALAQVAPDLAHDRYARIPFFVNAMTESHDLRFLRQLIFQETFAINRIDLRMLAACEWSFSSGSNAPSIDTPVRSMSIGCACFGINRSASSTCFGSMRAIAISDVNLLSSSTSGSSPLSKRYATSSKLAFSAISWMS